MSKDFPNNSDRAERAAEAVKAFAALTGIEQDDPRTQIQDLLADLFHLCDRHEIDVVEALRSGIHHYECEREEVEGKPCRVEYERMPWMENK
jgi:hypothetical protein